MTPLSLYIHIPWCIRKCPYCDFNSHKAEKVLPEIEYITALLKDLSEDLQRYELDKPEIHTIFIGGGTPSLISPKGYEMLFEGMQKLTTLSASTEITLEANPGTVEQNRFLGYRSAGINRLSLGIQSFNAASLKRLGRIHDDNQAINAIHQARRANFSNINLDIMHSLPDQTMQQGLADLSTAISFNPEHISWYQLTLEPNTVFYRTQPALPEEDESFELECNGFQLLHEKGYQRYEISAFCKPHREAKHNLNYWTFGDYIGIGAGAHGKITLKNGHIMRTTKHRMPKEYLKSEKPFLASEKTLSKEDLVFEFMLNSTRLQQSISNHLFVTRTQLSFEKIASKLCEAQEQSFIQLSNEGWQVTELGRKFTNTLQEIFLP
jgi:putative oxygen-independent coproporphyrinogen III oxidase